MKKKGGKVATRRADGSVSLRVCKEPTGERKAVKASTMGWRRFWVLAAVHVVMIGHIVQWVVTGSTLSPIEPSESMHTLERGAINAGFVFFSLAILSTLVFGRFVCGWGCHIIALQDACRWLMLKVGVRPKPFRSRLLIFVPLGLALYMFVWPNFKRWVLFPMLDWMDVAAPVWLKPVAPFGGFETEFIVEDFWATFAAWPVAIPFLLVVGFASVYFLGAKGFCTYGCPYGGFFAPVEQWSPMRIRVTDACEGCGHCTAACSSNVRVHEEVRDYGMVIDPGCMKCLDCVSVCPNDALYVGFGRPAKFAKPRDAEAAERWEMVRERRGRTLDASWAEEIVVIVSFVMLFWAYRGMMGLVPMLMAVGIAGIGAFAVLMGLKMLREPNVRIQQVQLKIKGKVRPGGWVFAVMLVALLGAGTWSGIVRGHRWHAEMMHASILVPSGALLQVEFQPAASDVARAQRGLRSWAKADARRAGGFGWALTPDDLVQRAFLELVAGERATAEATLRLVIEKGRPTDGLVFEVVGVMLARGATDDEVMNLLDDALTRHPSLHVVRREIAQRAASVAGIESALEVWETAPTNVKESPRYWLERARFHAIVGQGEEARDALDRADEHAGKHKDASLILDRMELGMALGVSQAENLETLRNMRVRDAALLLRRATLEFQMQQEGAARESLEAALEHRTATASVLMNGAHGLWQQEPERALGYAREALRRVRHSPYETMQMAGGFLSIAMASGRPELVQEALDHVRSAVEMKPDDSYLMTMEAIIFATAGRLDEASQAMVRAATIGDRNAVLAQRAAELFAYIGKDAESQEWSRRAAERAP